MSLKSGTNLNSPNVFFLKFVSDILSTLVITCILSPKGIINLPPMDNCCKSFFGNSLAPAVTIIQSYGDAPK